MKTYSDYSENLNLNARRAFLGRGLLALAGVGALAVGPQMAKAGFGPSNIPTEFLMSITTPVKLTQKISVVAQLRRLDGNPAGLAGKQAVFYAGNPTYPTTVIGRFVADASGVFRFSFPASVLRVAGNYVLIADVNPTAGAEGWIANPRPYGRFVVTR